MQFVRHDGVIFTPPSAPTARGCLHPTPSGRLKQSLAVPAAMLQLLLAIVAVAEAQSHAYGAPQRLSRDSGPKNNAPSALRHRSEDYRSVPGLMHCRSTSQPSARPRGGVGGGGGGRLHSRLEAKPQQRLRSLARMLEVKAAAWCLTPRLGEP